MLTLVCRYEESQRVVATPAYDDGRFDVIAWRDNLSNVLIVL
jgi:hypothetical protein